MVRSLRSLPHILSFTDRPLRLIRTMAMLLLLLLLADNVAQAQVNAEVRYRTDVNGVRWSAMVDQGTCIFGWCFSITSPDPVWKVTTRDNTDGGVWYGMTDYTFYSLERSQSGGYIRPLDGGLTGLGDVFVAPGDILGPLFAILGGNLTLEQLQALLANIRLLPAEIRNKNGTLAQTISYQGEFWEEDCGETELWSRGCSGFNNLVDLGFFNFILDFSCFLIPSTGGSFEYYGESGNCLRIFGFCTGVYACDASGSNDDDHAGPGILLNNYNFRNGQAPCQNVVLPSDGTSTGDFYNLGLFGAQPRLWWRYDQAPVVTIAGAAAYNKCINESAVTLNGSTNYDALSAPANREIGRIFQWQVSNSTDCSGATNWVNIPGANNRNYTVPQISGTRLYRLLSSPLCVNPAVNAIDPNDPLTGISNCIRVTYNPMNSTTNALPAPFFPTPHRAGDGPPPIQSGACGGKVTPGSVHLLNTLQPPAVGAVNNISSYTWTASGGTLVPSGSSATWTAPFTEGFYNINVTYVDACPQVNMTSATCVIEVSNSSCGFVYVDFANGNDVVTGGESFAPYKTLGYAIEKAGANSHIRLAGGTYDEPAIINMKSDIIVEGGFINNGGEWTKSSGNPTILRCAGQETVNGVCHRIGIRVNGATNWMMQDITVTTLDFPTGSSVVDPSNRGCSSYAIWMKDASFYTLTRTTFTAGRAARGAAGTAGQNGASGSPGLRGGTQSDGNSTAFTPGGAGGSAGASSWSPGGAGGAGGGTCGNNCGGGGNNGANPASGGSGGTGGQPTSTGSCCSRGDGNNAPDNATSYTTTSVATAGVNGGTASQSHTLTGDYFVPSGQGANGGHGYAGGGGGGGGASRGEQSGSITSGCLCVANTGNGGNGGGGGGAGGQGGTGGYGGGGAFSMWQINSQIGAVHYDVRINNPVAAGAGGPGGQGGNGGTGGGRGGAGGSQPARQNTNDDNRATGGQGGQGGNGARGGSGQTGASGVSYAIWRDNTQLAAEGNVPNPVTVTFNSGIGKACKNSVLTFTKTSGTWSWQPNFLPVRNLNENVTSYTSPTTNSPIEMYTTATGVYNVTVNGQDYQRWIVIDGAQHRPPPNITVNGDSLPDFAEICPNTTAELLHLNTFGTEIGFSWEIYGPNVSNWPQATGSPAFSYNTKDVPTAGPFTDTGYYLIKYQVQEICCGWSVPAFAKVRVVPPPTAPTTMGRVPDTDVCDGAMLTVTNASGSYGGTLDCSYEYRYSTDNGDSWSDWGASLPIFAAVEGTNLVQSRLNCDGAACPNSDPLERSWTVVGRPIAGEVVRDNPSYFEVCRDASLFVDVINASGGLAPFFEEIEYKIGAAGTWTPYTGSITGSLAAVGSEYYFRTRRASGAAGSAGCTASDWSEEVLLYLVVEDPSQLLITRVPDEPVVCTGSELTVATSGGTGGPSTECYNAYRYRINGGAWSDWDTLVPSYIPAAAGSYDIQAYRDCQGAVGCPTNTTQTVSWTIVAGSQLEFEASPSSNSSFQVCRGGTAKIYNNLITPMPVAPPSFTFTWQYSADGVGGWTDVVDATPTGITYTETSPNAASILSVIDDGTQAARSLYFRRILEITGASCVSISPVVRVDIFDEPVISFAALTDTFCAPLAVADTIPYFLTPIISSGGVSGIAYDYEWQYANAAGGPWNNIDISGSTTPDGNFNYITQQNGNLRITYRASTAVNKFFRLKVTSKNPPLNFTAHDCNSAYSPVFQLSYVAQPSYSGFARFVCRGSSYELVPVITGGIGALENLQWRYTLSTSTTRPGTAASDNNPTGINYPNGTTSTTLLVQSLGTEGIGTSQGRKNYWLESTAANSRGCLLNGANTVATPFINLYTFLVPTFSVQPASSSIICNNAVSTFDLSATRGLLGTGTSAAPPSSATNSPNRLYKYQWQYSTDSISWFNVSAGQPSGITSYATTTTGTGTSNLININSANGYGESSVGTGVNSTLTITPSGSVPSGTTIYYRLLMTSSSEVAATGTPIIADNSCTVVTETAVVTFTAPIVAPTDLVRIPDGSVCAGTSLSVVPASGASGGTNCQYEYRYNDGSGYTAWSTTVPLFTSVQGTNFVEMRYNCEFACNTNPTAAIQRSWTVVPALVQPVINGTKSPNVANICQGVSVSANITAGSGGGAGATNVYEYSVNGGAFWYSYTSGAAINTDTATGQVLIRVVRNPDPSVTGCNAVPTIIALWNVYPQVVPPTIASTSPATNEICQGEEVSAIITPGSGGGVDAEDTYEYRINGGSWQAYASGNGITTNSSTSSVEIRVSRSAGIGNGCTAGSNNYVWTAYPVPVQPTLDTPDPVATEICLGQSVSATFVAGSGGGAAAVDTFRISLDGGTTWALYTPGNSVSTASATGDVIIEGYRTSGAAAGCGSATFNELYRWTPYATISADKLPKIVIDCGNAATLEVTNLSPASAQVIWTLVAGIGDPDTAYSPQVFVSSLGAGQNIYEAVITLNGGCSTVVGRDTIFTSDPQDLATLDTQSPVGSSICGGDTIIVTINPGAGGGVGAVDSVLYSIDNGATWVDYTPGDPILTGAAVDTVFVIVYRTAGVGDGCVTIGPALLAKWEVTSAPTANLLPPVVDFCAGTVTLEAINFPPGATFTWSLVSGGGGTMSDPSDNPVVLTSLAAGSSSYDLLVSLGPTCQGIVDTVTFNYANFNDRISRSDVCNTCVITDGNTSIYYDSQGKIYAKVEDIAPDGGIALGSTQVCLDYIPHNPALPFQPQVADDEGNWQPYLNRRYTISPATSTGAIVTLYFYTGEYDSLVNRIDNHFDLDTRWKYRMVSTADLRVTKYPGGGSGSYTPPGPVSDNGELITPTAVTSGNGADGSYYELVLPPITSFSTFYIHPQSNRYPDAPLPVELVSFTATPMSSSIMLDWQTLSELNNDRFEVERSTDGINFQYIGEVPGAGTTNVPQFYQLEDTDVLAGVMYYYRLRIVDFSGTDEYSKIVSAIIQPRNGFVMGEFVPNPARNYSTIRVQTDVSTVVNFTLFSLEGKEVMKREFELNKGVSILDFDFNKLASGAYVGQFSTPDGWKVRKLVKID